MLRMYFRVARGVGFSIPTNPIVFVLFSVTALTLVAVAVALCILYVVARGLAWALRSLWSRYGPSNPTRGGSDEDQGVRA